jgi:AmmeMemoRadiSam system protein A
VNAPYDPPPLSAEEQGFLLSMARRSVRSALSHEILAPPTGVPPRLLERRGAFVTLRRERDLRGCIGMMPAGDPLIQTILRCAVAAALEDPRFPPVALEELSRLTVEVSVLAPARQVMDVEEIEVGRHGLIVAQGGRRALLLPQVAIEHGWDRLTLLRETCRKAGLDPDAWQRGARIEVFSAQVFSD